MSDPDSRSVGRRRLLVVGSFLCMALVTVVVGLSTATAMVAHVEASTGVEATVQDIEPAAEDDQITVHLVVENPTRADIQFRAAFLQVFEDDSVVASTSGIGFDRVVVPAGERGELTVQVAISEDEAAVRSSARSDSLTAAGHLDGQVVERSLRISVEDPTRA